MPLGRFDPSETAYDGSIVAAPSSNCQPGIFDRTLAQARRKRRGELCEPRGIIGRWLLSQSSSPPLFCRVVSKRERSPAQNFGENERRDDGGVGFDDETRSVNAQFSRDATCRVNISQRRIFPARHKDTEILVRGGDHPTVARVDLVKLLETTFLEDFEKEFVWKAAFFFLRGGDPFADHYSFDPANGFLFRNARVSDPIQMTTKQLFFFLRTQLTIIRQADVLAARDQIKKIFLQVRSCARDGMDLVPANHFRERNTELGGAHSARECDHHFSTAVEMRDVGISSVFQDCGVEMPVVAINELADAAHLHFTNFSIRALLAFDAKLLPQQSSVNCTFTENFLRDGGKDWRCQDFRRYAE